MVPVAEESDNQTETTDFHFIDFNTEDGRKSHTDYDDEPIDVKSCRTDVEDLDDLIVRYGHEIIEIVHLTPTEAKHVSYVTPLLDRNPQWSPLGSYLLGMYNGAIVIFGGGYRAFPPIKRYRHTMVERVDFSPREKYLVSYSRPEASNPKELWLKVFDVRTGILLAGVDGYVTNASWPVIRWAGGKGDKYFAILRKNAAYVYEAATFRLVGHKPLDVDDVVDISWSPTKSILALLRGVDKQAPKVVLIQVPGKVLLMQKDIPSLRDCKMYWHSNGKYLAVKVNQLTYSLFEIFCFKEDRTITTEVLKVDGNFVAFAWEPSGHRFAVTHGDPSKRVFSFYCMETSQNSGKVSKLATLDNKQADALFWSPRGKHIVLADLNGCFNGCLEFFDVHELKTMSTDKHPKVTDIAWDPTGRYVATAVTISQEMEISKCETETPEIDGFKMWSFNGEFLYVVPTKVYRLLQLEWRPYGRIIDDETLKTLEEIEEESEYSASDEDTVSSG